MTEEQTPQRKRFDEEMVDRSRQFGKDALDAVPELETIAVIPVWSVPQDQLAPAVFVTRDGKPQGPKQTILTLERLTRASEDRLFGMHQMLQSFDKTAGELAGKINERRAELVQIEQRLHELRVETAKTESQRRVPAAGVTGPGPCPAGPPGEKGVDGEGPGEETE